jgi:hypothetical protein
VVRDSKQRPVERAEHQPVNCRYCAKYDDEAKKGWDGFSRKNAYLFKSFLLAKAFGVLPRPGGTDQQDDETMDKFIILENIFNSSAEQVQTNMLSSIVGAS